MPFNVHIFPQGKVCKSNTHHCSGRPRRHTLKFEFKYVKFRLDFKKSYHEINRATSINNRWTKISHPFPFPAVRRTQWTPMLHSPTPAGPEPGQASAEMTIDALHLAPSWQEGQNARNEQMLFLLMRPSYPRETEPEASEKLATELFVEAEFSIQVQPHNFWKVWCMFE